MFDIQTGIFNRILQMLKNFYQMGVFFYNLEAVYAKKMKKIKSNKKNSLFSTARSSIFSCRANKNFSSEF